MHWNAPLIVRLAGLLHALVCTLCSLRDHKHIAVMLGVMFLNVTTQPVLRCWVGCILLEAYLISHYRVLNMKIILWSDHATWKRSWAVISTHTHDTQASCSSWPSLCHWLITCLMSFLVPNRTVDGGAINNAKRSLHGIIAVIPSYKHPLTGSYQEAKSSNAHIIPMVRELRRLGPKGVMAYGKRIDGELGWGCTNGTNLPYVSSESIKTVMYFVPPCRQLISTRHEFVSQL